MERAAESQVVGSAVGRLTAPVMMATPSPLSPMPEDLLNLLQEDEILDLMAYLLSGGDRGNKMFAQK